MLDNCIDLSHWNSLGQASKVKEAGIDFAILKATQGKGLVDREYKVHKGKLESVGIVCGSYHFGIKADGKEQADHFYNITKGEGVLCLDLENNDEKHGGTMSVEQAEDFVREIKRRTGRYPGLYLNLSKIKEIRGKNKDSVLLNCWLWVAKWTGPKPNARDIAPWDNWTLWQYSRESKVPGIKGDCDRSKFFGNEEQFKEFIERSSTS